MIPEKAQGKVNEATVVAVGAGAKNKVYTSLLMVVTTRDALVLYGRS